MDKPVLVTKPFLPPIEEYNKYLNMIWKSRWLTNQGPLHQQFIAELKEYLGIPCVTLTVNGHLALEIALRGLGISGEVITTPFTFASTTHAISLCGAKPVFCDIRDEEFTIDPNLIESLITEKTTAIMPVHVYGHLCDVEKISDIAHKYNLKVIYDAAHAFGCRYLGRSIASFGDVSMFSFHATKVFNTIEGGALAYCDPSHEELFNAYKNFGIENEESVPYIGGNAKMNEFQAAMGLANLPYMEKIIADRKKSTLCYRELLANIPGIRMFTPDKKAQYIYNYAYLPVEIDAKEFGLTRDALVLALRSDDIFARKYFFPITSEYRCYKDALHGANVPVAERAGRRVMTLPLYYGMGLDTVEYVCDCIRKKAKRV